MPLALATRSNTPRSSITSLLFLDASSCLAWSSARTLSASRSLRTVSRSAEVVASAPLSLRIWYMYLDTSIVPVVPTAGSLIVRLPHHFHRRPILLGRHHCEFVLSLCLGCLCFGLRIGRRRFR